MPYCPGVRGCTDKKASSAPPNENPKASSAEDCVFFVCRATKLVATFSHMFSPPMGLALTPWPYWSPLYMPLYILLKLGLIIPSMLFCVPFLDFLFLFDFLRLGLYIKSNNRKI